MKKVLILVLFTVLAMTPKVFGDVKSDMLPVLNKAKTGISSVLSAIDKDLAGAAKKLSTVDHKSAEARKILSAVCKDRPYVYDCGIVEPNGKLSEMEPESTRKFVGGNVGFQPQIKEVFKTRAPVASKVFTALNGLNYVNFLYPIFDGKGKLAGTVSLLVRHDQMLGGVVTPILRGLPYEIWVMQTDGLIMYDTDPNQVNKNIFTDPMFEPFDSLIMFSKTMAALRSGSGSYSFYKRGFKDRKIVDKAAVWDSAGLYKSEWRIVTMEAAK